MDIVIKYRHNWHRLKYRHNRNNIYWYNIDKIDIMNRGIKYRHNWYYRYNG